MSDPATNPAHELTEFPQDEQQHSRMHLGTFFALLRVLAGRRGHASLAWNRYGFTHVVTVQREQTTEGLVLDGDEDAHGGAVARERLSDALD
jgi:hypothetical protein